MSPSRSSVLGLVAAAALIATACSPERAPTTPVLPEGASLAAGGSGGGGNNAKVKLKMLQLSSNTLRIEGPSVVATISIGNSGPAIPSDVSIRAEVAQPAAFHEAANLPTACDQGGPAGGLPTGTCSMTFDVRASNSTGGAGDLVAGAAVLRVYVVQTVSGVATELASKTLDVNLVATPVISSFTLPNTTLAIDGPGSPYTATLENPGSSLPNVVLQGYMVQGATRRGAGGIAVTCGGSPGVLTPGTCVVSFVAVASNQGGGTGTLEPGPAQFELQFLQSINGVETVFDTRIVNVTLVSKDPKITSLVLASTELVIGGPSVDYTVEIRNPGFPIGPWVIIQGEIAQDNGQGGQVVRGAGGTLVSCGAGLGTLPTTGTGTCSIQFTVNASAESGPDGALTPGLARFILHLQNAPPDVTPTELDTKIVEVSLTSPSAPTITGITPSSSTIEINGVVASAQVAIDNPGPPLSDILVQAWISQGSARRAAGGQTIFCGAGIVGLPSGSCSTSTSVAASNASITQGSGFLKPGAATLEIELKQGGTVLTTSSTPITLIGPSITRATLSAVVEIGVAGTNSVTISNPTTTTYTNVSFGFYFLQGDMTPEGAGSLVSCGGALGALPPGDCQRSFTFELGNTYTPGPAILELRVYANNGDVLLYAVRYNITIQ